MTRIFRTSIARFFQDALLSFRKHPVSMLSVFLINLIFFAGAALLLREITTGFWDREILARLSRGTGSPIPLPFIHALGGRPLVMFSIPLILYLGFSAAFSLATIFTGPILTRMSARMDRNTTAPSVEHPPLRQFFFELGQELLMLALNVNISAALFVIGAALLSGALPASIAFYCIMPPVYGLYALSYAGLRRGIGYAGMTERVMRIPGRFLGFSAAAAPGYFLVFLLSGRIRGSISFFILLLAFTAFWRTAVAAAGTLFSRRNREALLDPPRKPATALRKILAGTNIFLALTVLATGVQAVTGMRARLGLLECRYRITGFRPRFRLTGISVSGAISVSNTTSSPILIPETLFFLGINGVRIADARLEKRKIPARGGTTVTVRAQALAIPAIRSLVRTIREGRISPELTALIRLPLWFGEIPLYVVRP